MTQKYIIPCAGYDRPGGKITRAVSERLMKNHDDVIIGSIGALFTERPGEIRDYRTSQIICLNGCGTNCASEIALARGREDVVVISIPETVRSAESFEEKIKLAVEAVEDKFEKVTAEEPKIAPEEPSREIEYLEEKIDKFTIQVAKGFKYSDNDFWVHVEGEHARIGVSDFLQQKMSDVYFVELAEPGTHVEMFDDAGVIESMKILLEIIVPLSGTIVEVNESLEDKPELVNENPYDQGWLYLMEPDDLTDLELLRDAADYMSHVLVEAKEVIGKKVE